MAIMAKELVERGNKSAAGQKCGVKSQMRWEGLGLGGDAKTQSSETGPT